MGIVISTTNFSPFSMVTSVIGLVSFGFTVSTFLRVVWVNIETMTEAPHEVHSYLTNLRTELLEEKASIRLMRRQARRYHRAVRRGEASENFIGIEMDEVTLKTMGDVVKHLIRQFEEVEKPFLEPGSEGIMGGSEWKRHSNGTHRSRRRRANSGSRGADDPENQYYQHPSYAPSPQEKGGSTRHHHRRASRARSRHRDRDRDRQQDNSHNEDDDEEEEEEEESEAFWAQRTRYATLTMGRRWVWVRKKSSAQALFETLSRVQIRRIARQVGGMSILMHEFGHEVIRGREMLERIDGRMGNIVGVRRVDRPE